MRFKYPNVVDGAISSSAPIIIDQMHPNAYMETVSLSFLESEKALGIDCFEFIKEGFDSMLQWENYNDLNEFFGFCSDVPLITTETEVQEVQDWLTGAYNFIAMLNYPYPADFVASMVVPLKFSPF